MMLFSVNFLSFWHSAVKIYKMIYTKASDAEVQKYFEAHPSHLEMVIADWEEFGDPELEWESIHDFTEFVIVPDVGVIPTYWESELSDDVRNPEWSSFIYEIYEYKIYKLLWFVVACMKEFSDRDLEIHPSSHFEKVVAGAEDRANEHDRNFSDFFSGWETHNFSNGKAFKESAFFPDIEVSELEEIECVYAPGYPEPEDLRASLLTSSENLLYVGINSMGTISLMQVDSADEARVIMSELWQ